MAGSGLGTGTSSRAGTVTISSTGTSYAQALLIRDTVSGGLIGLGVNVMISRADGEFNAYSDTNKYDDSGGRDGHIRALFRSDHHNVGLQDLLLRRDDAAKRRRSGRLVSAEVNVAVATAAPRPIRASRAAYCERGASDILNYRDRRRRGPCDQSDAAVQHQWIKIACNVLTAKLDGSQNAFAGGAAITANNLTVSSYFNKDKTAPGALAELGGNGGQHGVSLVSVALDVANAFMNTRSTRGSRAAISPSQER
jgi:hypothetical protein